VTFAFNVLRAVKLVHPAPVHRCSSKPVSLLLLSLQVTVIWLAEFTVACSPDGAAGALPEVVPLAVFE